MTETDYAHNAASAAITADGLPPGLTLHSVQFECTEQQIPAVALFALYQDPVSGWASEQIHPATFATLAAELESPTPEQPVTAGPPAPPEPSRIIRPDAGIVVPKLQVAKG